MSDVREPAARPCGSCPYRTDTPSGVWSAEEYEKLPRFDGQTWEQDPSIFMCHQADGRLCAGWVGCHDMMESMGLRLALARGSITGEIADACINYTTDVELYASGAEACAAGKAEIEDPSGAAIQTVAKLGRKREKV
jgi:hypothetical protein